MHRLHPHGYTKTIRPAALNVHSRESMIHKGAVASGLSHQNRTERVLVKGYEVIAVFIGQFH
ncbi:MAG: hypothetical protein ACQETM_11780, partial [Bacteroidota bacterium]